MEFTTQAKIESDLPLVSCLCVTKNKIEVLQRAIQCFKSQNYQNKELIIVKQNEDPIITQYFQDLGDKEITFINVSDAPQLSLGELRNLSIEKAKGEYMCIWDDDDWYHEERISVQIEAVLRNYHPATVLTNELIYDEFNGKLFFSQIRLWENSLVFNKSLFTQGIKYPPLPQGEDAHFMKQLMAKSKVFPRPFFCSFGE